MAQYFSKIVGIDYKETFVSTIKKIGLYLFKYFYCSRAQYLISQYY